MKQELKDVLEYMLEITQKAGADECDAILSKGESFSLSAQNGDIDKYKVSGSEVLGVRVIKDSKVGISYTESFDKDALNLAASSAVENALNSEENEYEHILATKGEMIEPCEFTKEDVSIEEKIDFCLRLESEVKKKDKRVQSVPYNGYAENEASSYYLSSSGLFGFHNEYYQSCYTSALLQAQNQSSMYYHSSIGRSFSELDLESCVEKSIYHAAQWLDAKALSTGNYDIIFTTDAFSEILNCFSLIYSGKSAMEGTNPYVDYLNQKVMSSALTIKDSPKYQKAFFKYHFDSEGQEHKDLHLIQDGVLKSFYHNSVTANYFGLDTTAHAARSPKGGLGVRGTTRVISTGTLSNNELESGEYLEIHSLQGLHSGADAISGEFSFAASGYLCRDGQRVAPVKGITVSGNFYKMMKEIHLIGDEQLSDAQRGFFAPKLRFEKMSVAGS
ncbi:MAG: TldD/PmbA family protein [Bacteriovoracaceae bacterium]|jgi:PmbA protein|nr:TldD/PmbA family protein [Bacteriovoracaceae bacterium]